MMIHAPVHMMRRLEHKIDSPLPAFRWYSICCPKAPCVHLLVRLGILVPRLCQKLTRDSDSSQRENGIFNSYRLGSFPRAPLQLLHCSLYRDSMPDSLLWVHLGTWQAFMGTCGHVCEVQLQLRSFAELKSSSGRSQGHRAYVAFRNALGI